MGPPYVPNGDDAVWPDWVPPTLQDFRNYPSEVPHRIDMKYKLLPIINQILRLNAEVTVLKTAVDLNIIEEESVRTRIGLSNAALYLAANFH